MTTVKAIIGPPGCGKTTSVAAEVRNRVVSTKYDLNALPAMVCSLTRAAAAEAAGRETGLPGRAIGTLHAFAKRALGSPELVAGNEEEFNRSVTADARLSPSDTDNPLADDAGTVETEYHRLRAMGVPRGRWPATVGLWSQKYEAWKRDADLVDFTDLIELATHETTHAPGKPRHLFMDEAQDSNRLMLALFRKWGAAAESLTIVGDPDQSLYQFCGAHPEMFFSDKIHERAVLGQSYRVPAAVHRSALQWREGLSEHKDIEYLPTPAEGTTGALRATWKTPEPVVEYALRELDAGRSVMVMASCAYMLAPVLAVLRRRGIPFSNRWRRKNGRWNPLAPRRGTTMKDQLLALLAPHRRDSWIWTLGEMERWIKSVKSAGLLHRGAKTQIAAAARENSDRFVTQDEFNQWVSGAISPFVGKNDSPEFARWWKDSLLASKRAPVEYLVRCIEHAGIEALEAEPRLTVGTIHSLKGSEADSVVVFPDVSSKGWKEYISHGERRDAVVRLGYVALTRAKQNLRVCFAAGRALPLGACV